MSRIAVVGGGLAGLAAAIRCAHAGQPHQRGREGRHGHCWPREGEFIAPKGS